MVLIIAACLLGLISNTTLSNNSTQTHDLFRLYDQIKTVIFE